MKCGNGQIMKHFVKRFDAAKLTLMWYRILLQAMREVLAEESYLLWIVAFANIGNHDETSVNNAYARLEHLRSSSERQRGMSDKRSAKGRITKKVPSKIKKKNKKNLEFLKKVSYTVIYETKSFIFSYMCSSFRFLRFC